MTEAPKTTAFWQAALAELRSQRDAALDRACSLRGELAEVRARLLELEEALLDANADTPIPAAERSHDDQA